jgi:HPt (histidine-containing phosphotransfer) domain-containing protein
MEMNNKLLDENIVAQFSTKQINTYFSLYLKNAASIIDSLQKDVANNDIEAVRQRAHKLKGSSMVVGATSLRNLSSDIEKEAKENNTIDNEKVTELKTQFEQLANLLNQRYNLSFSRGV